MILSVFEAVAEHIAHAGSFFTIDKNTTNIFQKKCDKHLTKQEK